MDEDRQTRRVTIRLTPFQARRLWKLRTADLPEGARPRTVTEVLVRALLDASRSQDRDETVMDHEAGLSRPHSPATPAGPMQAAGSGEEPLTHSDEGFSYGDSETSASREEAVPGPNGHASSHGAMLAPSK